VNTDAPATACIAVVETIGQSVGLTRDGIAATTFGALLAQPDAVTMGYFDGSTAVLYVTPAIVRIAEAVANRLRRLGIVVHEIREQLDGSRR